MSASALVLFGLVVSAPPLAEDAAYQEGVKLYEDFEYEKAVFRFKEALLDTTRSPSNRATILVRLGMTYAELRDLPSANAAFDEAVLADPLVSLPLDASPKIQRMLDDARTRARADRSDPEPPPDETPDPVVEEPVVETPPAVEEPAPVEDEPMDVVAETEGGMPWILIGGGAVAAVGLVVALLAGAAWGAGLGLTAFASGQQFQQDAATYALPAAVLQIGGQVGLGLGAAVLVVGGITAGVGFFIE